MKRLTTGKIFALCMGNFSRGMINGVITTYLLTFFIGPLTLLKNKAHLCIKPFSIKVPSGEEIVPSDMDTSDKAPFIGK